jgi:hypothetical protein
MGCILKSESVISRDLSDASGGGGAYICPQCKSTDFSGDSLLVITHDKYISGIRKLATGQNALALYQLGCVCCAGNNIREGMEWYYKAVELNNCHASTMLGLHLLKGDYGVDEDNTKNGLMLVDQGIQEGDPLGWVVLGKFHWDANNKMLALPHLMKAFMCGYTPESIWVFRDFNIGMILLESFRDGLLTKEEYGTALRAHQQALEGLDSEERQNYQARDFSSLYTWMSLV